MQQKTFSNFQRKKQLAFQVGLQTDFINEKLYMHLNRLKMAFKTTMNVSKL